MPKDFIDAEVLDVESADTRGSHPPAEFVDAEFTIGYPADWTEEQEELVADDLFYRLDLEDFLQLYPEYLHSDERKRSLTPVDHWVKRADEQLANPFVALQQQLEAVQEAVETLTTQETAKVERRTTLFLLGILFAGVAYIQVVHPLVFGAANRINSFVDNTKELLGSITGDVLKGDKANQVGVEFAIAGDRCQVTDVRRWRAEWNRSHNGVDVACFKGAHPLYSPIKGTLEVLQPAQSSGGGLTARIISSDRKWMIQIMHAESVTAQAGAIEAGQKLGTGGAAAGTVEAGDVTGSHDHIEVADISKGMEQRVYQDPTLNLIKATIQARGIYKP